MRLAALVVVLAGCFAPSAPTGVPCAMTAAGLACPEGQVCVVAGGSALCERMPGDPTDGSPPGDRDNDGVGDTIDNCPDRANADQGNEDGDRFGDVCDPCPPVADDNPPDADGDGVANACDPDATRADRIVLFEGFHGPLPASWDRTGAWTVTGDEVEVSAGGNNVVATLLPGVAVTALTRIAASVIVDATTTSTPDIDVVNPFGAADGVTCALAQAAGGRQLAMTELGAATTGNTTLAMAWTEGTPYVVTLDRTLARFSCEAKAQGATTRVGSTINTTFSTTAVGLRSHGITARYQWLMVITSP